MPTSKLISITSTGMGALFMVVGLAEDGSLWFCYPFNGGGWAPCPVSTVVDR